MTPFIKYIFLFALLFGTVSNTYSQKRHKQAKKSTSKTKAIKPNKKNGKKKTAVLKKVKQYNNVVSTPKNDNNTFLKDTMPEKVVTILSDFKPQLKNSAKISFNNAITPTDTSSLRLDYNVPSQNLSFQYKPISLVPRSFKIDSIIQSNFNGSIKIGFGNYLQRDIDMNLNVLDIYNNTHSINLYNNAYNGLHHLQTWNELGITYLNSININESNRLLTSVYYKQIDRNRYGMVPDSTHYPIGNYEQNYRLLGTSLTWINDQSAFGNFEYKPIINYEHFEGITNSNTNWLEFKNHANYKYNGTIHFTFDLNYNYNQLNASTSINNSLLLFNPSIHINKSNNNIVVGISAASENSKFNLYPVLTYSRKLKDSNYVFYAGWNTEMINNQYSNLVATNPWINVPINIAITTHDKKFIEIVINSSKKMDYGFIFSLNNYKNLPLYNRTINANVATAGLLYTTLFEKEASTIELEAKLRYQFSDKILIQNNFKYVQFNSLAVNAKPWGILPLELNSTIHWLPNKKWNVAGGLKFWSGAEMLNYKSIPVNLDNGLNLNAMVQYQFSKHWSTWFKGENLLDRPYERWLDYPSLGMQLKGGVVYSFRK